MYVGEQLRPRDVAEQAFFKPSDGLRCYWIKFLSCLIIGRNRNISAAAVLVVLVEVQNMKAEPELVTTTLDFSGHKKVTADFDISRADLREHYSSPSHGLPTVKSSSSH